MRLTPALGEPLPEIRGCPGLCGASRKALMGAQWRDAIVGTGHTTMKRTLTALAMLPAVAMPAFAQQVSQGDIDKKIEDAVDRKVEEENAKREQAEKDKLSGFGVGVAANYTFEDEIDSAFLDSNGIIRTNEKTRGDVAFILEGHFLSENSETYLPPPLQWLDGLTGPVFKRNCPEELICGMGPFLAVKTGGSSELIESIGVGYMWGTKHRNGSGALGGLSQWNFGLGVSIDPQVRRLANGMQQGEPLPAGETEIRYEEDIVFGLMMLFSIGIG